jgi:hypothetical protein
MPAAAELARKDCRKEATFEKELSLLPDVLISTPPILVTHVLRIASGMSNYKTDQ